MTTEIEEGDTVTYHPPNGEPTEATVERVVSGGDRAHLVVDERRLAAVPREDAIGADDGHFTPLSGGEN